MMSAQNELKDLEVSYIELKRVKEIIENKYQEKEMSYNKLEENYAELRSQLNKYENDIKVYKN